MANWALIKLINEVETVDNIIVASPEVAETYLVANEGAYDYVLDISLYSPTPQMGYTYDSGLDEFTAPAQDYEAQLEAALMALAAALDASIEAYALTPGGQQSEAVGNVLSALSEDPQYELMVTIVTAITGS